MTRSRSMEEQCGQQRDYSQSKLNNVIITLTTSSHCLGRDIHVDPWPHPLYRMPDNADTRRP